MGSSGSNAVNVKAATIATHSSPSDHPRAVFLKLSNLAHSWIRADLAFLVVLAASAAYSVSFSYLSILKYSTFNSTYDLGITNHTLWLLSHGGLSEYAASSFSNVYPFQYEKPIQFLVLPIYLVAPGISTLLVIQSVAIGCAAIPLYLFSRTALGERVGAVIISISYLVFFPLASANLYDVTTDFICFAPLFFFSACYFWLRQKRGWFVLSTFLLATLNPLTLVTSILFLVTSDFFRLEDEGRLRAIHRALSSFWRDRLRVAAVGVLLGVLLAYQIAGTLYLAGTGGQSSNSPAFSILTYSMNQKFLLVVYLLASVAFVPLFRLSWLILVVPYFGWVFYSTNAAHWALFGLMYPLLAAGPVYFGVVLSLASTRRRVLRIQDGVSPTENEHSSRRRAPIKRLASFGRIDTPYARMVSGMVVMGIFFAVLYSPFSPVNAQVTGGYFNGNHELSTITGVTPQVQFLHRVISLIPPEASVLTQDNIPQLSSREYWQPADLYSPSIPFDYILMDTSLTYFAGLSSLIPFVSSGINNGTFGILAEGEGAILLERGYTGLPVLAVPLNVSYDSATLSLGPNSTSDGSSIVAGQPAYDMWFGPYASLYPGSYVATFELKSNTTQPAGAVAIYLDVVSGSAPVVYDRIPVYLGNFSSAGQPMTFSIPFHLSLFTEGVQFRGMFPTGAAQLTLLGVSLLQTSLQ